jgi:8-amino-7-oxononanoate synthase
VFSMDGDVAPLDDIAGACARWGALLVLDEAHAVLGPAGAGLAGIEGLEVLRVGTLSKTLGSLGGFVAGSRRACDLLVNRARSYIFTTASTPADTAAALANLGVVRSAEGDALRARLRANIDRLRPGHPSPIVPVVVGDEADAVAASARLLDAGLLVPAIRPPTVAPGTSRLRIALSAAHTAGQVDRLVAGLTAAGLSARP